MVNFVECINKTVIHTAERDVPIAIGERFVLSANQREYAVAGIVSSLGSSDKTVVLQPVSHSEISYKEYL